MTWRVEVDGFAPFEAEPGVTLLDACEAVGVPMQSDCGGFAACNACRVRVIEGADHLGPVDPAEEAFVDADDQRLGCQATVCGPVRVRLDPGLD